MADGACRLPVLELPTPAHFSPLRPDRLFYIGEFRPEMNRKNLTILSDLRFATNWGWRDKLGNAIS
jgi:hypothetical protein